jgi:very-short-patch-repair endonuclease
VTIHQRQLAPNEFTRRDRIPVTSPSLVLVDLAASFSSKDLEAAVNEACQEDLTDPETLRKNLDAMPRRPGIRPLKRLLDHDAFRLTDSELERMFLRILRAASLPLPLTQHVLGKYRVDFFFPDQGVVVEADSLRFHRTAARQRKDYERDQAHLLAGLTPLRFTHWQIAREPEHVARVLDATFARERV